MSKAHHQSTDRDVSLDKVKLTPTLKPVSIHQLSGGVTVVPVELESSKEQEVLVVLLTTV